MLNKIYFDNPFFSFQSTIVTFNKFSHAHGEGCSADPLKLPRWAILNETPELADVV